MEGGKKETQGEGKLNEMEGKIDASREYKELLKYPRECNERKKIYKKEVEEIENHFQSSNTNWFGVRLPINTIG